MRIRTCAMTAAVAAVSVVVSAASVAAAPEAAADAVHYRTALAGNAVVAELEGGTFAMTADQASVAVRDEAGWQLDVLPLVADVDGQRVPIRPEISGDGHSLKLTPDATGVDRTALRPVASPVENQLAMNDLINAVSIGTSVGSLIGSAIGGVVGIGVGLAVSGAACLVISLGCVVAVLPIVSLVGAVGGLAGLVIGGGPTALAAAYNYFTTMNAAPGTSMYSQYVPGAAH
ncbi:hypothetical protein [Nocardia sp. NPDC005825]|uniref:hypothetical protein n=1 Tax=unclassified Nocardia TaxID=2637762 RepID=UPI0033E02983